MIKISQILQTFYVKNQSQISLCVWTKYIHEKLKMNGKFILRIQTRYLLLVVALLTSSWRMTSKRERDELDKLTFYPKMNWVDNQKRGIRRPASMKFSKSKSNLSIDSVGSSMMKKKSQPKFMSNVTTKCTF